MPYNPGNENHADKYIYGSLTNLGNDIGDGVKEMYAKRDESQFWNQKVDSLKDLTDPQTGAPLLKPEELSKLYGASTSAQKAAVADAHYRYEGALAQRAFDAEQGWKGDASARGWDDNEIQRQAHAPYTPPAEVLDAAKGAGYLYLPQSAHGGSYVPAHAGAATGAPQIYDLNGIQVVTDGKHAPTVVRPPSNGQGLSSAAQLDLSQKIISHQSEIEAANKEISRLKSESAKAGQRTGADFLPAWMPGSGDAYSDLIGKQQAIIDGATKNIAVAQDAYRQVQQTGRAPVQPSAPAPGKTLPRGGVPAVEPPLPGTDDRQLTPPQILPVKQLDGVKAKEFLDAAGGDVTKARQAAREAGYTF